MKKFWILIVLGVVAGCSLTSQDLRSGGVLKPEQANMDVLFYSIALDVDFINNSINGHAVVTFDFEDTAEGILLDLWHGLQVRKVEVNHLDVSFEHTKDDLLKIGYDITFPAGKYEVKVHYGGKPAKAENPPWKGGFQWEKDSRGNHWMAITCQGEGGKIYFPCKDHPSDKPDLGAELIITVPEDLVVAGPGMIESHTIENGKATWHWKTHYPISNYSIVFNVGKYVLAERDYETRNGNKVPMHFYILEENIQKADKHLTLLERSLGVLEKYFGEYPFADEKVGIVETPHLGMEHQTMNAYGNKFRYQTIGEVDFDWLMHHELGHEWWGNKVFNRDWAHMWIQEGICSFGDALFTLEYAGQEAYNRQMRMTARNVKNQLPIIPGEVADSDEVYQPDIYGKGAFFMHTLKYILGNELFFRILLDFIHEPAYTYIHPVDTDDVEQYFSLRSGQNLKPIFDFYLKTTKWLEIEIRQNEKGAYEARLANFDGVLPMEFETDKGVIKTKLGQDWETIPSSIYPVADPEGYYLKKVK